MNTQYIILTVSEYNYLRSAGVLNIHKSRIKNISSSESKSNIFIDLMLSCPSIGLNPESYVISVINKKIFSIDEFVYIDITYIKNFYSVNNQASQILNLKAFNNDLDWNNWVKRITQDSLPVKSHILREIICRKLQLNYNTIAINNTQNYDDSYLFPNAEESKKLDDFKMSYVFGWKAGLTILFRLCLEIIDKQTLTKEYWTIGDLKNRLEELRQNQIDGPILEQEIYTTIHNLDALLIKIPNYDPLRIPPISFLAIVLQYSTLAENKHTFELENLIQDIRKFIAEKNNNNDYWLFKLINIMSKYIDGSKLCDQYMSKKLYVHKKKRMKTHKKVLVRQSGIKNKECQHKNTKCWQVTIRVLPMKKKENQYKNTLSSDNDQLHETTPDKNKTSEQKGKKTSSSKENNQSKNKRSKKNDDKNNDIKMQNTLG